MVVHEEGRKRRGIIIAAAVVAEAWGVGLAAVDFLRVALYWVVEEIKSISRWRKH